MLDAARTWVAQHATIDTVAEHWVRAVEAAAACPSDRPVLADPRPRPPAAPPLRVPIGQMMHLNGSVPRGADLRNATHRYCQGCGGLFIVLRRAGGRAGRLECALLRGLSGPKVPVLLPPRRRARARLPPAAVRTVPRVPRRARACGRSFALLRGVSGPTMLGVQHVGGHHSAHCHYERRQRRPGSPNIMGWSARRIFLASTLSIAPAPSGSRAGLWRRGGGRCPRRGDLAAGEAGLPDRGARRAYFL